MDMFLGLELSIYTPQVKVFVCASSPRSKQSHIPNEQKQVQRQEKHFQAYQGAEPSRSFPSRDTPRGM